MISVKMDPAEAIFRLISFNRQYVVFVYSIVFLVRLEVKGQIRLHQT